MVTNRGFGQIMDEADNAGFFKILRPEDLSSELMRGIPCHFIKSISEKNFSSKMVEDMHMPNETMMFKLHDPKGNKSWEVMYKVTGTQSRFSAGWIRLAKELPLVIGDVCTFKLIKPTEMLLNVSKKRTTR